jgi:hypothetical protein
VTTNTMCKAFSHSMRDSLRYSCGASQLPCGACAVI